MADSVRQQDYVTKIDLKLPLQVKVTGAGPVCTGDLETIAKNFKNDINLFHVDLAANDNLKHINVIDIQFINNQIVLIFQLINEDQLLQLYDTLKNADNILSQFITEFSNHHSWELHANHTIGTKLDCKVVLPKKAFTELLLCFEKEEESHLEDITVNEDKNINQDKSGSIGKQTSIVPDDKTSASALCSASNSNGHDENNSIVKSTVHHYEAQLSGKQHNGDRKITMGQSLKSSMIEKCFMVLSPFDRTLNVEMKSNSMNELNCHLSIHNCGKYYNIYEVRLLLPPCFSEDTVFWYEINYKSSEYFGFKKTKPVFSSKYFGIRKCSIQRDVIDDKLCVHGHLSDIVFHCSDKRNVHELCIEVEDVCGHALQMSIENAIYELSLEYFNNNNQLIMFGIIMGYLHCHHKLKLIHHLKNGRNLEERIVQALNGIQLRDLPSSCSLYMPLLLQQLCQIVLGNGYSQLGYFNCSYPFIGEKILNDALISCINSKQVLAIEDYESKKHSLELCKKLYRNSCTGENNVEPCKHILEKLLQKLPISLTLNVIRNLQKDVTAEVSEQEKDLQCSLIECLRSQINPILNTIEKNGSLNMLMTLVKDIFESHVLLEESLTEQIEKCLINTVTISSNKLKSSLELETCFMSLHNDFHYFTSLPAQQEFIKTCTELANSVTLDCFIALSKHKPILKAYQTLGTETYKVCLQNMIKSNAGSRKDALLFMFEKLIELHGISGVKDNVNVRKELAEIAKQELINYPVKELLKKWQKVEDICDQMDIISEICKKHLQEQLAKKGQKSHEILLCLCGTNGELRVNSRTTANLVGVMIDCLCKKPENGSVFEQFLDILPDAMFWQVISAGSGKKFCDVQNETYHCVCSCITHVSKHFKLNEVTLDFLEKCRQHRTNAEILLVLGGLLQKDIKDRFSQVDRHVLEEKGKITTVKKVLHELLKRATYVHGISKLLEYTEEIETKLQKVTVSECFDNGRIWTEIKDLPDSCDALQMLISSDVFWNLCSDKVKSSYTAYFNNAVSIDEIECIPLLFQTSSEMLDCEKVRNGLCFIRILHDEGITLYRHAWLRLKSDDALSMKAILNMFRATNVFKEIDIAETFLREKIDKLAKKTLTRLEDKYIIQEKIDAMTSILKVFGYDIKNDQELFVAVESYEKLITGDISEHTFSAVKLCLQTLFDIADQLSDVTVRIMAEVSKSSQLLKFLRTIVDEDIRNLIDAVEDISEQHVRETTVSALIDVKRFFSPVLHYVQCSEKYSRWLFHTIEKQVKAIDKNAVGLIAKINECMSSLHNLKSLYKNVANRGEQTKEIITNIVKRGSFSFSLDTNKNCVNFVISYKQNKANINRQESVIVDLRSRALLLMNTERLPKESKSNQDEFKTFVDSVDLCLDTRDILFDLYRQGHTKFVSIKVEKQLSHLKDYNSLLKNELQSWNEILHKKRKQYFLLNFIQGVQIHALLHYLEKSGEEQDVETMLKFIHPQMKAVHLKQAYDICKSSEIELLECIGNALHEAFPDENCNCSFVSDENTAKITDVVHSGKVLVVNLEDNSLFIVKTILALFLNTTHCLPTPNQVLFCNKETSWEELYLLIERCLHAEKFYGTKTLFCIANVEILTNSMQFKLVESVKQLRDSNNFLLAIVCCGSRNDPFVNELGDYTTTVHPLSDTAIKTIYSQQCPEVCTFTSEVAGLGKTTSVFKYAHEKQRGVVTIHVSEPVRKTDLIKKISEMKIAEYNVLHIDVGSVENTSALDIFFFELILLRYVSCGRQSVYLPTVHVAIEIANTINNRLRNSLQTVVSFKKNHLVWNNFSDFKVSTEANSPVQVVCKYLRSLEDNTIDKVDILFTGPNTCPPFSESVCRDLLRKYLNTNDDISFSIVHIFLSVLADQLKKMSCSSFFRVKQISDMVGHVTIPTVRSTLFKSMLDVSREFASRSVNACRSTQLSTLSLNSDSKESTDTGLAEKAVERVASMVRWEESNHLIYVFHNQNIQTLSPMYRNLDNVPKHIRQLFEGQMKRNMNDFGNMKQDELQKILQMVARYNPESLTEDILAQIGKGYALTPDNLLKMILIMMRVKANVPVIIMGETGCGKTSLIRYLAKICEVQFEVLNIHAGVSTEMIIAVVMTANLEALKSLQKEIWLFLDEFNTSENISMIANIICHHQCLGKCLAPNLTIMGACNPYKIRTKQTILTAGLEGKVKTDELSKLVYRVLPLPEMLVDYVWDFGSLSENDEAKYIDRMITGVFPSKPQHQSLFKLLISVSQIFVRTKEESSCVVSLRDVHRCRILVEWFLIILPKKTKKTNKDETYKWSIEIRSIILSLAHCYYSRFSDKSVRSDYRHVLAANFSKMQEYQSLTEYVIQNIIKEEQEDILTRMDLPQGIARNNALQENVFVLLVCILNRIPIFLVGKPGCSKSLAMQVIRSNLRGKDSEDEFFKQLPQLYCVSFQGSESSTSDGIIKVFEKAEMYQTSNSQDDVLSVVILDEIGLAEVSRFNPLKVLHNLLEPDGKMRPDLAVVGISNWSLDSSKMNRAIHLSRPDMDADELYETGLSISDSLAKIVNRAGGMISGEKHPTLSTEDISTDLKQVAISYVDYTKNLRFKNFHGLRDFYSLVKFISKEFATRKHNLSVQEKSSIIMTGLERNFGGLPRERKNLLDAFKNCFSNILPQNTPVMKLITENIQDQMARHLMLITNGEAVLGIVEQHLHDIGREQKEVIIGSHFEEDLTDDYNYRILSKIILCMEHGLVLILKDLNSIYGSLYDMLNQNYTVIGKKKNCRIALGPYSNPICHVADTFRCIVFVNEQHIDYSDPPFLNRFEKQHLSFADILSQEQQEIVRLLETWLESISTIVGKSFSNDDVFPIYSSELIPSLVLLLTKDSKYTTKDFDNNVTNCIQELLWIMKPEAVVRMPCCADDQIKDSYDEIKCQYFDLPLNKGIAFLVEYQTSLEKEFNNINNMTIVFTNSNIHTKVLQSIGRKVQIEKLGSFKSEKQLSLRIQQFWSDHSTEILFVQCSAVEDERHILLTKSIIEHFKKVYKATPLQDIQKYVYLIIHLEKSRSNSDLQINYLSGWKLVMLDILECPVVPLLELCESTIVNVIEKKRPLSNCIKEELFWALTRIRYGKQSRNVTTITEILNKMKTSNTFLSILDEQIWSVIQKNVSLDKDKWQIEVACDIQVLSTSASFVEALERHILSTIRLPLAKLLYKLESLGALDSFFVQDEHTQERQSFWEKMSKQEKILCIKNVPDETGPDCYICETIDLSLQMPFSRIVFECLECCRDDFLSEVTKLKSMFGIEIDTELPIDILKEAFSQQESYILHRAPHLSLFSYESLSKDYLKDFFNLVSYSACTCLSKDTRIHCMHWAMSDGLGLHDDDPFGFFIKLHCCFWTKSELYKSVLQLFDICHVVLQSESSHLFKELDEFCKYSNGTHKQMHGLKMKTEEKLIEFSVDGKKVCVNKSLSSDSNQDIIPSCNEGIKCSLEYASTQEKIIFEMEEEPNNTQFNDNGNRVSDLSNETLRQQSSTLSSYGGKISEHAENCHDEISKQISPDFTSLPVDSDNDMENNKFVNLVAFVCSKVLPTTKNIGLFNGLASWQKQVRNIIMLAAEVSREPAILHALRFCDDLVQWLILPFSSDDTCLDEIVCHLQESYDLESEQIFLVVQNIILSAPQSSSYECQKVLSQYLLRCIAANPDTQAYKFVFTLISSSNTFDKYVGLMKSPIYQLLTLDDVTLNEEQSDETDDKSKRNTTIFLTNLLKQNEGVLFNDDDESESEVNAVQEHAFLSDLDNCLISLYESGRFDSPFVILLVDIIQDLFDSSEYVQEDVLNFMLTSGSILKENHFGIKFITALAFMKSAIKRLAPSVISFPTDDIVHCLNAVYCGVNKLPIQHSMLLFFVKHLGENLVYSDLKKTVEKLLENFQFLQSLSWTDEYIFNCIEGNPLALFVQPLLLTENDYLMKQQSIKTLTENMKTLVKLSKENKSGLMLMFCLILKEFYLARYQTVITDTIATHRDILWQEIKCNSYLECQEVFMKCILGKKDFNSKQLMLEGVTSSRQYMMNSVLTSTYALVLANHEISSILPTFLFRPSSINDAFLPGFLDTLDFIPSVWKFNSAFTCDVTLILCICGQRLAFANGISCNLYQCTSCNEFFSASELFDSEGNEIFSSGSHSGYIRNAHMTEINYCTRYLSPVSCNVLLFLIKGCLIGSLALELSTDVEVCNVICQNANELNAEQQLWNEMDIHWQHLKELLNLNDKCLGTFFIAVLHRAQKNLIENVEWRSLKGRNIWEEEFEALMRNLIQDHFTVILQAIQTCDKLQRITQPTLEQFICEADTCSSGTDIEHKEFSLLFRLSSKPAKNDFITHLLALPQKFPFLLTVLENEQMLSLPKHIYNILQWHFAVVTSASYMIKSYECFKLNAQEFIEKMKDFNKINILQKHFKAFFTTWNTLKTQLHDIGIKELPDLNRFHMDTKMSECVIVNEDSVVFQVLSRLVAIQNTFLDKCLKLSFVCDNLHHLSRNKQTSAVLSVSNSSVRPEHLINMDFDWDTLLLQESYCSLKYGQGRQVQYDFHTIEKELVHELLIGKAYIDLHTLPSIVFTDELYKTFASLITDVRTNIQQEPLPSDILSSVKSRNNEFPNMATDLLNHLGMILTMLKKSKYDPQKSLLNFVEEKTNILGGSFPKYLLPTPDVRMCHVISLHETLEELCAESKIDALDEEFMQSMEQFVYTHFIDMSKTKPKHVEIVIKAFKRFIYRCLCMKIVSFNQRLSSILYDPSFWPCDMSGSTLTIAGEKVKLDDLIPSDLQVCHVRAVLVLLEEQIEIQKQSQVTVGVKFNALKSQLKPDELYKTARKKRAANHRKS